MGCANSKQRDVPKEKPANAANAQPSPAPPIAIPEVQWEVNTEWGQSLEAQWRKAVEAGNETKFRAEFQSYLYTIVRKWADNAEPACAKAGTIEDTGELILRTSKGPCAYPAKTILTLDDNFTGVIYSATLVMAPQLKGSGADEPWMKAGAALETEEFKSAQRTILEMLATIRQSDVNVDHALVHVFVGADMASCKFDTAASEPTITVMSDEPNEEFKENNDKLAQVALDEPDEMRGVFPPLMFRTALQKAATDYPGSTTWDEGEFPFSVDGEPYQYPTRLLLARDFHKMSERVDTAYYQMVASQDPTDISDARLVRNLDPEKNPGGIVFATLILGNDPDVLWPTFGQYAGSPVFAAAEKALIEHINTLYKNGLLRACGVRISLGADQKRLKFVGDAPTNTPKIKHEEIKTIPESSRRQYTDLEGFFIDLQEKPKHELFDSESQFQAVKNHVLARAQEDPDFFNNMAPQIAVMAGTHMLSLNFPDCEVSDEGEFPVIMPDGTEMKISDSRLLLVKDPKQEPKSIVAAMYVVPNPSGGDAFPVNSKTNWLQSKEMNEAEDALLELLKKLYEQGKVSEVDCMAQVMIGTDASIHQFVEGSKFIDYSDERMAQVKWG